MKLEIKIIRKDLRNQKIGWKEINKEKQWRSKDRWKTKTDALKTKRTKSEKRKEEMVFITRIQRNKKKIT